MTNADYVLAKVAFYRERDRVTREEVALLNIPAWRLLRRARQSARVLEARVSLTVAESKVKRLERERA